MKKILIMLFMLTLSCFAIDIKITDDVFDNGQFVDFCANNNEIYILARDVTNKIDPVIYKYNNKQWSKIEFPKVDSMQLIDGESDINVDAKGNLWVAGWNYLYKYANGTWENYYIEDEFKEFRGFMQFVIDKNNNIWITSIVNNYDDKIQKSELWKFDGSNFENVFVFNTIFSFVRRTGMGMASTITYTDDDKIIFQRTFEKSREGLTEDSSFNDIYILNTDKTYKRIKTQNAILNETDIWDEMNQNISHIYSSRSNEIWFLLSKRMFKYPDNPEYIGFMGGGLSLYKDGEWILFDSTNNLTRYNELNYDEMGRILDLNNGKYLLFGRVNCYLLDYNSTHLEKLEWSDLLKNGEFIKFNNNLSDEKILSDFTKLAEKDNGKFYITEAKLYKNSIYLLIGRGLLILPLNNFTNITESVPNDYLVYPNPATDYIYIEKGEQSNLGDTKIIIYNTLGNPVLSGDMQNSTRLDIRHLPSGLYFVKFNNTFKQIIINR